MTPIYIYVVTNHLSTRGNFRAAFFCDEYQQLQRRFAVEAQNQFADLTSPLVATYEQPVASLRDDNPLDLVAVTCHNSHFFCEKPSGCDEVAVGSRSVTSNTAVTS